LRLVDSFVVFYVKGPFFVRQPKLFLCPEEKWVRLIAIEKVLGIDKQGGG
jgi:hypothetical protein